MAPHKKLFILKGLKVPLQELQKNPIGKCNGQLICRRLDQLLMSGLPHSKMEMYFFGAGNIFGSRVSGIQYLLVQFQTCGNIKAGDVHDLQNPAWLIFYKI